MKVIILTPEQLNQKITEEVQSQLDMILGQSQVKTENKDIHSSDAQDILKFLNNVFNIDFVNHLKKMNGNVKSNSVGKTCSYHGNQTNEIKQEPSFDELLLNIMNTLSNSSKNEKVKNENKVKQDDFLKSEKALEILKFFTNEFSIQKGKFEVIKKYLDSMLENEIIDKETHLKITKRTQDYTDSLLGLHSIMHSNMCK